MHDLERTYLDYDFSLLHAIADQAGVSLSAPNPRAAAVELAAALKAPGALELLLDRVLDDPARAALAALLEHQGRHPAAAFIRRFGDVRPLGPNALDRERPWETPATAAEALYFNGLAGRAFMDSEQGPQEFFYIPSDLMPLLPAMTSPLTVHPAQAVAPADPAAPETRIASSVLVDDAVTLLAAIQCSPGRRPASAGLGHHLRLPVFDFLSALLAELALITADDKLDPENVKPFLQSARPDQLRRLADAWRDSRAWNDLLHVPGLRPEPGSWTNDPVATRVFLLRLCADLPGGEWRSLDSFVAFVHDYHPDFQRPAGEYDSWYIRDASTGDYVRGFDNWERVEGALIRYLLTGPMHWLGLVDTRPDSFRLSLIFHAFARGEPWQIADKPARIICKHDGTLIVSRSVNRYDRFQAARIGDWRTRPARAAANDGAEAKDADYEYCLTGTALQNAMAQGITAKHITAFLRRTCEHAPGHILDMVERWGRNGIEARASQIVILRLAHPDVLEQLMRSPKTRRWLGEAIGESAVEVKDWEKLREAMAEIGIVGEFVENKTRPVHP
jgi:hypothetical protein